MPPQGSLLFATFFKFTDNTKMSFAKLRRKCDVALSITIIVDGR